MRLSAREKELLVCIEQRGRGTAIEFSNYTGMREHTVRHLLRSLTNREIIVGRHPIINLYPLGYSEYTYYFALSTPKPGMREKVVESCTKLPGVSWVASLVGDYELGISIYAQSTEQVHRVLTSLIQRYGEIFLDKALTITRHFHLWPRLHLAPRQEVQEPLHYGNADDVVELDERDHLILSILATRGLTSGRHLAREIGLSHTAVERRLDYLEREGIVAGYVYRFNLSELGMLTYRLALTTRGLSTKFVSQIKAYCSAHPNVLRLFETMGEWDFQIDVEVQSSEQIASITGELHAKFGAKLHRVQSHQVLRTGRYFAGYPLKK